MISERTEQTANTQQDELLVRQAQSGDNEAEARLLDKYKPLVKAKSRAYFLIGADTEDIIQEGMIGLYKAIRDYDKEKNASFRSFAELCINRQMITAIKAATRQKHQPLNSYISLNKPVFEEDSEETYLDLLQEGELLNPEALLIGQENKNFLENQMEKKVKNYSLGMKQRLGIAMALARFPKLLILDEPTNGLDPIGIAEVRNFIKDLSVDRGKTILISSHILSEIALLADDIGIIDHGVLLEESSMEDLEKKNRKYIQLQVSDIPKASLILERQFHVTDYAVQDEHNLRLYDTALDMAAINKALVVQDVAVISSQICNDTLEDYFKQITGGEGIA